VNDSRANEPNMGPTKNFCYFCGVSFDQPTQLCPLCSSADVSAEDEALAATVRVAAVPVVAAPAPATRQIDASALQEEELAGYRLRRLLGRGSMGAVYLGEKPDGSRAAIKMLRPKYTQNADLVGRFLREAKAVSGLKHPNIVEIYDSGFDAGLGYYLVLEFLRGESLLEYININGRLSPYEAVSLTCQMLDGLQAAHEQGVVHRDLKPANIFLQTLTQPPRVKLLDFGVAKLLDKGNLSITRTGAVLGTPAYMSPEQSAGKRDIDGRADLYAVGVILFELLTGRRPFLAETPSQLLVMHQIELPPVPSGLVPKIPKALDAVVLACLEKDPRDRPSSARALRERLQALLPNLSRRVAPQSSPSQEGAAGEAATKVDSRPPAALLDSQTSLAGAVGEMVADPPRRRAIAWAASVVVLGLLVGVCALWRPFAPSAAVSADAPKSAEVVLYASPSEAQVFDEQGKSLGTTPFRTTRGQVPLRITLKAEGYEPMLIMLEPNGPAQMVARLQETKRPNSDK
jgi:serine/threonine protein kinase